MPWDAPEAVVDIDSTELISLGSFPDKVGLFGRRKEAAVSHIMGGRNSRSVRFVVPDGRIVDRDVTVVYMEEEREPMVVLSDMTRLRELWPVEVFDHMKWYQQDLELLRKSAKKDYQQTRPMPCRFCGKVIRVDMYRHVARLHIDLVWWNGQSGTQYTTIVPLYIAICRAYLLIHPASLHSFLQHIILVPFLSEQYYRLPTCDRAQYSIPRLPAKRML